MKRAQYCIAPLTLCKYYMFSLDMLVSITSTLWLHYFWTLSFVNDCKAWPSSGTHSLYLSLSVTVFTFSLFLLIYSLSASFSFSHHLIFFCTESVYLFLCHLFIVFLCLLSKHRLHPFRLSLFCLSVTLILLPSHVCILYFSICLSTSTYYYFFLFSLSPTLSSLPSPLSFFPMFLFLSPSTTCATEGNIMSSGPCWTITMQSNSNRDVCRKQHVCNYCLMRPLSQAECPIRLPMRKRCQGPLKKEREEGEGGLGRVIKK